MYIKLKEPIKVHEVTYPESIHIISTRDNVKIHTPFFYEYVLIRVFETGKKFILHPDQIKPRKKDLTKWNLVLTGVKLSLI